MTLPPTYTLDEIIKALRMVFDAGARPERLMIYFRSDETVSPNQRTGKDRRK